MSERSQTRLAPAWRAWVAENLTRGVSKERLVELLEQAGVEPSQARAELEAAGASLAVRLGCERARQQSTLEALLGTWGALYRQSSEGRQVERQAHLAPAEFFERYYFRHRPVLLQGLLEDWPALSRWSPQLLAERFGDQEVELMQGREGDPDPDYRTDHLRAMLPMREFVARVLAAGETNDFYLVARNELLGREAFRPLLEDIRAPAGYIRPDIHEPDSCHLWFGPAGTLSVLHHDHINVLFCQVFGRKRFTLLPSFDLPQVYNDRAVFSAVDIRVPDLERFPRWGRATAQEVVVGPGEVLFIPVGWWHAVQALEVSLSVTFVCFDLPAPNVRWRNCRLDLPPERAET